MKNAIFIVVSIIFLQPSFGQNKQAERLANNIVAIEALFKAGFSQEGFGFICGESQDSFYVATASHILTAWGEDCDSVNVKYQGKNNTSYFAKADIRDLEDNNYDLALLACKKTNQLSWDSSFFSNPPKKGQKVIFLNWQVPSGSCTGEIEKIKDSIITVGLKGVRTGDSGSPLISVSGIVGMLSRTDREQFEVIDSRKIEELFTEAGKYPYRYTNHRAKIVDDIIEPEMVFVKGGSFLQGCTQKRCRSDELPYRKVLLKDFMIGKFEVTNKEFCHFLNSRGTHFETKGTRYYVGIGDEDCKIIVKDGVFVPEDECEDLPVVEVTWYGAKDYAEWLSEQLGYTFRLPTESEWEYAAKGGKSSNLRFAGSNKLDDVGYFRRNSKKRANRAISIAKQPNTLGIYNMSGNVWEWCQDNWHNNYINAPSDGSAWLGKDKNAHDKLKVLRGGGWSNRASHCRVNNRSYADVYKTDNHRGFRLVREIE